MRLIRRQRRLIITRFNLRNLENQAISKIEKDINKLSVEEINFKIGKIKKVYKNERLNKYMESILCNNQGCSECSV